MNRDEPRFSRVRLVISRASISRRDAANYARGGGSKSEKSLETRKPRPILFCSLLLARSPAFPSVSRFPPLSFFIPVSVDLFGPGSEAGSKNYRCYRITAHDNGPSPRRKSVFARPIRCAAAISRDGTTRCN